MDQSDSAQHCSAQSQRVTISDVARAAGVSDQTVSRTVHDSPAVKESTKQHVRNVMRELGYRPNFAGRSLRRGHYRAIGVVIPDVRSTGNLDRLDGLATAAEEEGYAITLLKMSSPDQTLQQAADRMLALPVDGMIFTMNHVAPDFDSFVPPDHLQTVIITMKEHPVCSTVDNNQQGCSRTVVKYLLDHGHRSIAHIAGPLKSLSSIQREEGWRSALAELGIEAPAVLRGDWTAQAGFAAGEQIANSPDITAVYASNDAMAYGCIEALRARGKRVPEDISVIGVDNSLEDLVPNLELTTVQFDNRRVGSWAFRKLTGSDADPAMREHVLFPGTLIERSSVSTRF